MIVELFRVGGRQTSLSTGGLLSIDGVNKFSTLEPPAGPKLIPVGTYHVVKEFSPRFNRFTPHIQDVPGHDYEEMHVGNFPEDTEGCVLIGETWTPDYIGCSVAAFATLMGILPDEFDLVISQV